MNPFHSLDARSLVDRLASAAVVALVQMLVSLPSPATPAELWVGTATADITPEGPAAMEGVTFATTIRNRCTASVLALESRHGDRVLDQAVLVSCDLCILPGVQEGFRKHLAGRQPGFDLNKLSLAATHTHTSPMVLKSAYNDKDYGKAVQPKDYLPFLYGRMGDAVSKAWNSRAPGAVAWGLGHAVVGHNRRVVYRDGTAKMHGNTNDPQFSHIEGYEDHAVDILCFYNAQRRLTATAIAMACTAQATGGAFIRVDVPLVHLVRQVDLPARIVTPAEYEAAKKICDEMDAKKVRGHREWYWRGYQGLIVERYLAQQKGQWKTFPIEMHVLRLGDVAIATNPFELFLDYGVQIQARSPAPQTILIELASPAGYAGYVPTPRAVQAGGYSAEVLVNMIGPDGGQALVDRTLEAIGELFKK